MWTPEGYVSWTEMVAELRQETAKILFHAVVFKEKGQAGAEEFLNTYSAEKVFLKSGLTTTTQEARLTLAIATGWVAANFMAYYPPVAVGLFGGRVELWPVFFEHMDQLDYCRFAWPLHEASEYSNFFRYRIEGGFRPEDIFDRFPLIDFESGRFRVRNGRVILPVLTGRDRRTHAAIFSFMAGVTPPMPMLGRSLL